MARSGRHTCTTSPEGNTADVSKTRLTIRIRLSATRRSRTSFVAGGIVLGSRSPVRNGYQRQVGPSGDLEEQPGLVAAPVFETYPRYATRHPLRSTFAPEASRVGVGILRAVLPCAGEGALLDEIFGESREHYRRSKAFVLRWSSTMITDGSLVITVLTGDELYPDDIFLEGEFPIQSIQLSAQGPLSCRGLLKIPPAVSMALWRRERCSLRRTNAQYRENGAQILKASSPSPVNSCNCGCFFMVIPSRMFFS
ncbi:hypothetical protein E4U17_005826 [Claviceps sp. LM77 group G4]|nr:hypothetical protein E4U17_005826 [Claviceps sp. LM77 group G4]